MRPGWRGDDSQASHAPCSLQRPLIPTSFSDLLAGSTPPRLAVAVRAVAALAALHSHALATPIPVPPNGFGEDSLESRPVHPCMTTAVVNCSVPALPPWTPPHHYGTLEVCGITWARYRQPTPSSRRNPCQLIRCPRSSYCPLLVRHQFRAARPSTCSARLRTPTTMAGPA